MKPFLEVTHTASFMKLTVRAVDVIFVMSRVDIRSETPNVPFALPCILTSIIENSATAQ
jgi:hypothetical protein